MEAAKTGQKWPRTAGRLDTIDEGRAVTLEAPLNWASLQLELDVRLVLTLKRGPLLPPGRAGNKQARRARLRLGRLAKSGESGAPDKWTSWRVFRASLGGPRGLRTLPEAVCR